MAISTVGRKLYKYIYINEACGALRAEVQLVAEAQVVANTKK